VAHFPFAIKYVKKCTECIQIKIITSAWRPGLGALHGKLIYKLRKLNTINDVVAVKQPKIGVRKNMNKTVIVYSNTPIAKIVKRRPNGTNKNKKTSIPSRDSK